MKLTRREALGAFAAAPVVAAAQATPFLEGGPDPHLLAADPVTSAAPFSLPPLPYAPDALEPQIDAETMKLHHDKHHATYVTKLNEAIAATPGLAGRSIEALLSDLGAVPESARTAVRNHGGGHFNHTLFWTSMTRGGRAPEGAIAAALGTAFGSLQSFSEAFQKAAAGVFGSGWAWLVRGGDGQLGIETTPNQDTPLASGKVPLLGVDVWEHAYYLRYQNRRADYLKAWMEIVDWREVGERLRRASA
jgi:Fe-Mn family superoxide dismutase